MAICIKKSLQILILTDTEFLDSDFKPTLPHPSKKKFENQENFFWLQYFKNFPTIPENSEKMVEI